MYSVLFFDNPLFWLNLTSPRIRIDLFFLAAEQEYIKKLEVQEFNSTQGLESLNSLYKIIPFSLLLGKNVVIQQFWTPNCWKLLVLVWLFNHLLEPLSHLLLDLQFLSLNRWKLFTVGEPKSVGPTKFPQQKREGNSNPNSFYCWGA